MAGLRAVAVLTLTAWLASSAAAEMFLPENEARQEIGGVQPAYRFVEGISDGVYDFMRTRVIGVILPGRLSRNLKAAPQTDSAPLFEDNLRRNEARFLVRARESYPVAGMGSGPARLQEWCTWAGEEQVSVTVDALQSTLLERYQLELFGKSSEAYARDRRNWDAGLVTMAGLIGGSIMYFNGLRASAEVRRFKLDVDLRSGLRMRQAFTGGSVHRLAGVELGYQGLPVTVATEWGMDKGEVNNERVGLMYRLQF